MIDQIVKDEALLLEGKTVHYTDRQWQQLGLVAGFDYDIGLSIVDAHDTSQVLFCMQGPFSPLFTKDFLFPYDRYDSHFLALKQELEKGHIDVSELGNVGREASAETCPFNR